MYTEAQKKILEIFFRIGIIPVISIDDAAKAKRQDCRHLPEAGVQRLRCPFGPEVSIFHMGFHRPRTVGFFCLSPCICPENMQ